MNIETLKSLLSWIAIPPLFLWSCVAAQAAEWGADARGRLRTMGRFPSMLGLPVDPVCGMSVDQAKAGHHANRRRFDHFLCSAMWLEGFDKDLVRHARPVAAEAFAAAGSALASIRCANGA